MLLIAAVIVITVLLNVVVSTLDNVWGLSYDLSSNKLYTISAQSKKVVSAVNQPVNIYALMQTGSESTTIENLLENYRKLAPDYIKVTVVDPVQNPTFANQFTQESLSTNSVIVTNGDGSRYRVIDQYDMYEFGYNSTTYQSYAASSFIGEQKLTNAISFVTAEEVKNAYFLTGHQEASSQQSVVPDGLHRGRKPCRGRVSPSPISTSSRRAISSSSPRPQSDLTEDERVAHQGVPRGRRLHAVPDAMPTCSRSCPGLSRCSTCTASPMDHTLVVEGNENAVLPQPRLPRAHRRGRTR